MTELEAQIKTANPDALDGLLKYIEDKEISPHELYRAGVSCMNSNTFQCVLASAVLHEVEKDPRGFLDDIECERFVDAAMQALEQNVKCLELVGAILVNFNKHVHNTRLGKKLTAYYYQARFAVGKMQNIMEILLDQNGHELFCKSCGETVYAPHDCAYNRSGLEMRMRQRSKLPISAEKFGETDSGTALEEAAK